MTEKKQYLVIGGTSGIGLEIVRILGKDGAHIHVGSRSAESLEDIPGVNHIPYDASRERLDRSVLPDALDGLVYCPGSIQLRPFARLTEADFESDFRINLLGAVNAIQDALPALKKSPKGASIVLFSTVAVQTGMPFHAAIASAKGAVEGLTRSLAAELAPRIRVNAIAPSLTDTPLAGQLLADDDKRKASAERHPLKRIGNPGEVAQTAIFLLSDAASWITGQILAVDGGMGAVRTFK